MARTWYGGTPGDAVAVVNPDDGDYAPAAGTFTIWNAETAGTQLTDLLNASGTQVAVVTPDAKGVLKYAGPDGYNGPTWAADSTGYRWRIDPADLASRVGSGPGTIASTNITDSGATGRSLIQAADASTARGVLGVSSTAQVDTALAAKAPLVSPALTGNPTAPTPATTDNDTSIATTAYVKANLTGKADTSGSVRQFADVADTTPVGEEALVYNTEAGQYVPTNLATRYTSRGVDGRLAPADEPLHMLKGWVGNEGDPVPTNLPAGALVFRRQTAPSLVPVLLDDNFNQGAGAVVLTTPEALAVGSYIGIAVAASNEATPGPLAAFTVAFSTGAGTVTWGTAASATTTIFENIALVKITTLVPAGATITITARDAANAAITRPHMLASAFRMPNLTATDPMDQKAVGSGNSSTTMTAVGAAVTTDTAQANEVAIGVAGWNSGVGTVVRTLAGTNDWQQISQFESETTSARSLFVAYKVLTAVGRPSFTTLMTASDGATGGWAATMATFKGV